MDLKKLLVANRGEVAIRVARAAAELGIESVAIHSEDDADSLHTRIADRAVALQGRGARAYLSVEGVVAAALENDCDALHPGYGFLSENAELARACEAAGIAFVGPTAGQLELFGDKLAARALAQELDVPLIAATGHATSLDEARAFLDEHGAVMIKAVAGGGGRGMRPVRAGDDLNAAYERCQGEARAAFGNSDVYVERLIERARHIEIQIIGDGSQVSQLGERECTLQRQNQKLVEIAPSPTLADEIRERLASAALRMARHANYLSLGTFEFLVDADDSAVTAFIETNARLQVEHTVTEEVMGLDLVQSQLRIACGAGLAELGLAQDQLSPPRGYAIQCRINTETMSPEGRARPSSGTLLAFEAPSGPGVRSDSCGFVGYTTNPSFDSLLAKLIAHSPSGSYADVIRRMRRALAEFRIDGVPTNLGYLKALLERSEIETNQVTTRYIEEHASELAKTVTEHEQRLSAGTAQTAPAPGFAGVKVGSDPLAVLRYGSVDGETAPESSAPQVTAAPTPVVSPIAGPEGSLAVSAPLQGTIVSVDVAEGDAIAAGQALLVMEAMKMEHVVSANCDGLVRRIDVREGDAVFEGHPLIFVEEAEVDVDRAQAVGRVDIDAIREDLQEVIDRHAVGYDENKPEAVAKRHGRGNRTARENLAQLVDEGSFVEYGPLMVAAQRKRRSLEDLIANTQGDGMVAGIGSVNGSLFGDEASQAVVMSYDYMVLAGTQGAQNHRKKDRLFEVAENNRLPLVLFAEGGGGRPGDTDGIGGSGLDCWAFYYIARLSGLVPLVGITNGRCFAGNAVLLGCCDVIIATRGSNIGVGGPAMIEGGGLGVFRPEDVGPVDVQYPNGVIDILVEDEEEAVEVAKKYLSYFQGPLDDWQAHDPRELRHLIPENRLRIYDVRQVIEKLCDVDSVLEIRAGWGDGLVTALARIEGRPIGVIANNPHHLAGAIDADAGDKGARFMQLCDAHDIPLLFLCDTPGIMVGPQAEIDATVRHASRMFVTAASMDIPHMTIVLRKGYGLGAQAMAGGGFRVPLFTVAWPTGEFGGMGLEGFVKLGFRKELEAIEDPQERIALYEKMVARLYENGKAVSTATFFEIDDVIDPAASREWITMALLAAPKPPPRTGKKRPMIDTW
ncbi:MAG: carbamoyl-phosphate synthase large subunit [bacterium]|nr:carbamoyl-phosphate synthase large subunit [bacterium]